MLRLFFDLKTKQGQRAELVTGLFQQNVRFIAKAKLGLKPAKHRNLLLGRKARSVNVGWCATKCCPSSAVKKTVQILGRG